MPINPEHPLRITYEDYQVPHKDCNYSADSVSRHQDQCHVLVNVTDGDETHSLRFDRRFDHQKKDITFELSLKQSGGNGEGLNSQAQVSWFISHKNPPEILNIIRVLGGTLSAEGIAKPTAEERAKKIFPLVLANYIVTGRAIFPGDKKIQTSETLASNVLDVFANSDPISVRSFTSKLGIYKADSSLTEEARQRVNWIDSLLLKVPDYQKFSNEFIPEPIRETIANDDSWMEAIQKFVARVVIDLGTGGKFKYDAKTLAAYDAYNRLIEEYNDGQPESQKLNKVDFCHALEEAVVRGLNRPSLRGEHLMAECRNGLKLIQMDPKNAALESIRLSFQSPAGLQALQATIIREVRKSKMTSDWLAERGQVERVSKILLNHSKVRILYDSQGVRQKEGPLPPGESEPEKKIQSLKIEVDSAALKTSLNLLLQGEKKGKHREPVLASLGVLRMIFGYKGQKTRIPVFLNGEFQEVPLLFSQETLQETLKMLEADLKTSFRRSEVGWPVAQGVSAALGVLSMGVGIFVKDLPQEARQGMTCGGSSLVGFSFGSMVNLSPRAKNKHKWGAVGGSAGLAIGAGTCLGAVLGTDAWEEKSGPGNNPPGPGDKFPVDDYGP